MQQRQGKMRFSINDNDKGSFSKKRTLPPEVITEKDSFEQKIFYYLKEVFQQ
jgi:hypothetical protein